MNTVVSLEVGRNFRMGVGWVGRGKKGLESLDLTQSNAATLWIPQVNLYLSPQLSLLFSNKQGRPSTSCNFSLIAVARTTRKWGKEQTDLQRKKKKTPLQKNNSSKWNYYINSNRNCSSAKRKVKRNEKRGATFCCACIQAVWETRT